MVKVQSTRNSLKNKKESQRKQTQCLQHSRWTIKNNRKYIVVSVNNKPVCFQFDTASDITLISQTSWKLLGEPCLSATDHIARSASGDQIHLTGELTCNVTFQVTTFSGVCYLAEKSELNLIGLDWIEQLNLFEIPLKFVFNTFSFTSVSDIVKHLTGELKNKFSDVFQESLWLLY